MKNKMKKIISALRHAKERPDWRRKFIKEIKDNGFKSAINKMKNKIHISHNIEFIPNLITSSISYNELLFSIQLDPVVTIVIPVYNNFDYTYKCLQSILENSEDTSYEIIIADDNSSDETINLAQYAQNITIIKDGINRGFLLNCNNAAQYARGTYILFLNNDTQVQSQWLSSLVELIESDATIGMVGSKLVYPDGKLQEAGGIIWNDASGWNYGHRDDPTKPEYNYVKEVDYISGASLMIKKTLWETIGGFDERYVPAYYEDSDLAFEVRKHGYKVVYQPKSVVVHFEGISNGIDLGSGIKKYQVVNREKFIDKWKDELEKNHFPNAENVFVARDRSKDNKHLLFVDHYLPHYDQDAGSKAAYQYLQILSKSGIQVHFIGDNFWHYPDTPYLDALTYMGIEVLYGNHYARNWQQWIKDNGKYFDYTVLSRPHITLKYIDLIKEHSNAKVIYFGHDLHFLREEREYEIKKEQHYLKSSKKWKTKEIALMKKADIAYFFSDIEKDVILQNDASLNVDVVPLFIYDSFEQKEYLPQNRKDIMFVGGFGHSPNVDAIKWFIEEIWPKVVVELPSIKFYIIGSKPPKEIQELASQNIIVTGFISDEELEMYYARCRLVVAPLRYGAGVKGKIVDALYHGIPVITTTIGAEGIQEAEKVMHIANESQTFADAISSLYENEEILKTLSQKSFENCKNFFSQSYAVTQMKHVIKEIGVSK